MRLLLSNIRRAGVSSDFKGRVCAIQIIPNLCTSVRAHAYELNARLFARCAFPNQPALYFNPLRRIGKAKTQMRAKVGADDRSRSLDCNPIFTEVQYKSAVARFELT